MPPPVRQGLMTPTSPPTPTFCSCFRACVVVVGWGTQRLLFKQFDSKSYGYLTRDQFAGMISTVCPLPKPELGFLASLVDPDETDRIDYTAVYHRLYQTTRVLSRRWEWMASARHTIRSVVVITRHGARFPLKPFPRDEHWPKENQFWKTYGGRCAVCAVCVCVRVCVRVQCACAVCVCVQCVCAVWYACLSLSFPLPPLLPPLSCAKSQCTCCMPSERICCISVRFGFLPAGSPLLGCSSTFPWAASCVRSI